MAGLVDFTETLENNGKTGLREVGKKQAEIFRSNEALESAAKAAKKSAGMTGLGLGVSAGVAGGLGAAGVLATGGIGLGVGLLAYELL